MSARTFEFNAHGGQQSDSSRPGKITWPHYLHVRIEKKHEAAELAQLLIRYLADARDEPFVWSVLGELVEIDEDKDPAAEMAIPPQTEGTDRP